MALRDISEDGVHPGASGMEKMARHGAPHCNLF
jgi:lysophospholipase L1-like esterase